ncbi:MAG: peptidoglycan-associated lipoprotein Pal [Methylococcaceae bacterium]|nr:peptidoglycan-associated lipoprotein Pal [Methylococcaceae bacterium]
MKEIIYKIIILSFVALLLGCETTGDAEGGLSEDEAALGAGRKTGQGADQNGANSQGFDSGSDYSGSPLDDPQSPLSRRVIYFLYDSVEIKPEFIPIIEAHARYLVSHPEIQVTLEGHADERGSREYNIALGEQRANSVSRKLGIEGVGSSQISVVSYGEEKPVSFGHDETAWQLNRRVEFRYPGN